MSQEEYKESEYDKYWKEKGDYGRIRIERKKARKLKRKERKSSKFICSSCGDTFPHVVQLVENPYYKDMYDSSYMERLCNWCYNSALGDI